MLGIFRTMEHFSIAARNELHAVHIDPMMGIRLKQLSRNKHPASARK